MKINERRKSVQFTLDLFYAGGMTSQNGLCLGILRLFSFYFLNPPGWSRVKGKKTKSIRSVINVHKTRRWILKLVETCLWRLFKHKQRVRVIQDVYT